MWRVIHRNGPTNLLLYHSLVGSTQTPHADGGKMMNCLRPNLEPGLPHSIISFATLVTIMDPLPRAWLPAGTKPRAFSYSSTSYYHQNQNQSPLTTATKTHIHTTKRTLMPVVVSRKTEPWVGNSRTMKLKPQTFWSHLHQPQHLSGILQGRVFPFSIKGLVHI